MKTWIWAGTTKGRRFVIEDGIDADTIYEIMVRPVSAGGLRLPVDLSATATITTSRDAIAGPAPAFDLLTGLEAHWRCEETAGGLIDAHGSNNMTLTGTVGRVPGKLNFGRGAVDATERWEISAGAGSDFDLQGLVSMSFFGWIWMNSQSTDQSICEIYHATTSWQKFIFRYEVAFDTLIFHMFDGAGGDIAGGDGGSSFPTGEWVAVGCAFDAVTKLISIYRRTVTGPAIFRQFAGQSAGWGNTASGAPFRIGGITASSLLGNMDSMSWWKNRALTLSHFNALWNNGNALDLDGFQ